MEWHHRNISGYGNRKTNARSLQIFALLHLIPGIRLHIAVLTAGKASGHPVSHSSYRFRPCSSPYSETKILRGLFNGSHGYLHLFISIRQVVPILLHTEDKQFALVRKLILGIAYLEFLFPHVIRNRPTNRIKELKLWQNPSRKGWSLSIRLSYIYPPPMATVGRYLPTVMRRCSLLALRFCCNK